MLNKRFINNFFSEEEMQILSKNVLLTACKHPILRQKLASAVYPSSTVLLNKCSLKTSSVQQNTEQKLLKFPAFPLKDTLNKLLITAQPFLSEKEFADNKRVVQSFLCGQGQQLQTLLEIAAKQSDNWLAERWLNGAYLELRDPVTVYTSPGMTFDPMKFNSLDEWLQFAANAVYGALLYKRRIDEGKLRILKVGENVLDNSQYYKVFGACRIPCSPRDVLEIYHCTSKHIVVIIKNHFFYLPVINCEGDIVDVKFLRKFLKKIYEVSETIGYAQPVGAMTAQNRDIWARNYECLTSDENNCKVAKKIQSSLFVLCLDDSVPVSDKNRLEVAAEQVIHGGGARQNSGNRWFDKCIQIIVNRNGLGGFCYEHSPAEGVAIAEMVDFLVDFNKKPEYCFSGTPDSGAEPCLLKFNVNDDIINRIDDALIFCNKLAERLKLKIFYYDGYGKDFLKKHKLSPDSFCQMAMQYAYYRMYCKPAATYESAHLRIYKNGRTETIRSCSNESLAFAKAFVEDTVSDAEKVKLLRKAIDVHRKYTSEALMGKGVDRHLFGLKAMAKENGIELDKNFFNSAAVQRSSYYQLSTSQVPSKHFAFMGYGPAVDDGYGICYNPRNQDMFFAISAWDCDHTDAVKFAKILCHCLEHMKEALSNDSMCAVKSKL